MVSKLSGFALPIVISLALASAASASDAPKRKLGIWEINSTVSGMKSTIEECVAQSNELLQLDANNGSSECSVMDINPQVDGVTIHSVCKLGDITAVTNGKLVGDFTTKYNGEINTKFDKSMNGISQTTVTVEAKWVGPCHPDQPPGLAKASTSDLKGSVDMNDPHTKEFVNGFMNAIKAQQNK